MKATLPWLNPTIAAHHTGRRRYGVRSVRCSVCNKLFRKEDINEQGICIWDAWERLPWWQQLLEMKGGEYDATRQ